MLFKEGTQEGMQKITWLVDGYDSQNQKPILQFDKKIKYKITGLS
jgi:hypothetical protein